MYTRAALLLLWVFLAHHALPTTASVSRQPCRLIFSLNPGRSGSGYLARILGLAQGVDAGHERHPTMLHDVLRQAKLLGLGWTYKHRKALKLPSILAVLERGHVYAETSHGFIKTFWDVVMDAFASDQDLSSQRCRTDIIVLERDLPSIVCSLYRRNWTRLHRDWLIEPGSMLSTLQVVPEEPASEIDNLVWYVLDHREKEAEFRRRYLVNPRVHFHYTSLPFLQTLKGVDNLFRALNLTFGPSAKVTGPKAIVGKPYNRNPPKFERIPCPTAAVEKSKLSLLMKREKERQRWRREGT